MPSLKFAHAAAAAGTATCSRSGTARRRTMPRTPTPLPSTSGMLVAAGSGTGAGSSRRSMHSGSSSSTSRSTITQGATQQGGAGGGEPTVRCCGLPDENRGGLGFYAVSPAARRRPTRPFVQLADDRLPAATACSHLLALIHLSQRTAKVFTHLIFSILATPWPGSEPSALPQGVESASRTSPVAVRAAPHCGTARRRLRREPGSGASAGSTHRPDHLRPDRISCALVGTGPRHVVGGTGAGPAHYHQGEEADLHSAAGRCGFSCCRWPCWPAPSGRLPLSARSGARRRPGGPSRTWRNPSDSRRGAQGGAIAAMRAILAVGWLARRSPATASSSRRSRPCGFRTADQLWQRCYQESPAK